MKALVLFASLAACRVASPATQEPAPAAAGFGWVLARLDVDVRLRPDERTWTAAGTARLRLTHERSAGPTLAVRHSDFRSVSAGDATVDTTKRHHRLESVRLAAIRLPRPARRGDLVDVAFEIVLRDTMDQLYIDGDVALASWTQAWYPFPLPEHDGYTAGDARAPGTTRLHLPPGWRALAEGRRSELTQTAEGTVEAWTTDDAVARSFAAGPYRVGSHTIDGRRIDVYVLGRDAGAAAEQARSLAGAIAALERRFGPLPSRGYAIAEVPAGKVSFTAAAQQGFLMAASSAFHFGPNLPLFAHEAAHAWWGNAVSTRGPGGIVCSESLAQYGAVLAIEALEGTAAATAFLRFSRRGYSPMQCARGYFRMLWLGQDRPLSRLDSGGFQHDLADSKGHWVLHMLRHRVGDATFFATLRELLATHAGSSMSLDDLREAFVAAAEPGADIERFLAQWLDRNGAPELVCEWRGAAAAVELDITQRQPGEPYDLRLDVALQLEGGGELRHEVHLAERTQRFALPVASAVVRSVRDVVLDPDHRLLVWTPEYGPAPPTAGDDPALDETTRAGYLGVYTTGSSRRLEIVERGERIGLQRGDGVFALRHLDGHRFRTVTGVLEFVFENGAVVAIDFTGDDGRRERATRTPIAEPGAGKEPR